MPVFPACLGSFPVVGGSCRGHMWSVGVTSDQWGSYVVSRDHVRLLYMSRV